jgi:hypothetical protein
MNKEYKIAKGWKIFIWIALPIFMIIPFGLSITFYIEYGFSLTFALVILPICLGILFLIILGLIDSIKGKYILTDNKIITVGIFKTKELFFADIKGFTNNENNLTFHPKTKEHKKIKVSVYINNFNEFAIWAKQNFKNITLEESIREEQEVLNNKEIGRTIEESSEKLDRARKLTKLLNTISIFIALATILYPKFYKLQIIACVGLPLLGLIILKNSKGLIKLNENPKSKLPNLVSTLLMPTIALALRALIDFNVLNFSNAFKFSTAFIILLTIFLFSSSELTFNLKKIKTYLIIIVISFFGAIYSISSIIVTNGIFEKNEPTGYKASVIDKRINYGKTTTYYLKLSQWGPQIEVKEVSVAKEIYSKKEIGDEVNIYYNVGLFDIPYYIVMNE